MANISATITVGAPTVMVALISPYHFTTLKGWCLAQ